VIGIDNNIPGELPQDGYTYDLIMLHMDQGEWPEEYLEKAKLFRDGLGYFKGTNETHIYEDEYPIVDGGNNSQ
jgi:hypothetical protein